MPASSGGGWNPPAQAVSQDDLVIPQDDGGGPQTPPVYAAFVGPDVPVYNQDFELIGAAGEIDQLVAIQETTGGFLALQATENQLWFEVVGTEETYYIPAVPVEAAPEDAAVVTVNDGMTVDEYISAMQDRALTPADQGGEINIAAVDAATAESILGEDVLILRPVTIGGSTYIPVTPAQGSDQVYFIPLASIPYDGAPESSGPAPIPVTITEDGGAQVYAPMFAEQEVPLPFMDEPYLDDEGRNPHATMFSVDQALNINGTLTWGQEIASLQIIADEETLARATEGLQELIATGEGATQDYQIALDILTGAMAMPEDPEALHTVVNILTISFLDLNDHTRNSGGSVFFEGEGTTAFTADYDTAVDFSFELFAYEQQGNEYLPYSAQGYQPQTEQVFTGWVPVDGVTLGEGVQGVVTQLAVDPADRHSLYGYIQGMGWVRISTTDAAPEDVEAMFNEQFDVQEGGGILEAIGTGFGYIIDVPEAWVGAAIFDVGEIFGDENLQAVGLSTIGNTWIGDLAGIDTEFALNWAFDVNIPDNEILWRQASYNFMSMFNEVGAAAYENGDTGAMFLAGAGKFIWTAFEFYTLSTAFSGAGELIAGGEGAAAWQATAAFILTEAGPRVMMLPMYAQMGEQAWALVSGDLEGGEQWIAATDLISFFGGSAAMTVVSGVRQGRVTDLRSAGTAAGTDVVRNFVFIGSAAGSEALFGTSVPGLAPIAGVTIADIYNHFRTQTSSSTDITTQETNYSETLRPTEHTTTIDQATGLVLDDFVVRDMNGNVIAAGRVITNPQTGAQAYRVMNDAASPAASTATSAVMAGVSSVVGEVNASQTAIVPAQQDPFAIASTQTHAGIAAPQTAGYLPGAIAVENWPVLMVVGELAYAEAPVASVSNTHGPIETPYGTWVPDTSRPTTPSGWVPYHLEDNHTITGFMTPDGAFLAGEGGGIPLPMQQGNVIGRGTHAEIIDLGDGTVLKRYFSPEPALMAREMDALQRYSGTGVFPEFVRQVDGQSFIMTRVEGVTLSEATPDMINPGAFARLNDRMQRAGITYGDWDPANVMVMPNGELMLVDPQTAGMSPLGSMDLSVLARRFGQSIGR